MAEPSRRLGSFGFATFSLALRRLGRIAHSLSSLQLLGLRGLSSSRRKNKDLCLLGCFATPVRREDSQVLALVRQCRRRAQATRKAAEQAAWKEACHLPLLLMYVTPWYLAPQAPLEKLVECSAPIWEASLEEPPDPLRSSKGLLKV